MGTIEKGAIPSTIREGGFVTMDEKRNLGIITTKNCATK
jgi:hypothetical protein